LAAEENIEILVLLATAPEADLRKKALETLHNWDRADVLRVMASPKTAPDVLRFAAEQLLAGREELRKVLLWNPSLPPESRRLLQPVPAPTPALAAVEPTAARLPAQPQPEIPPQRSNPETEGDFTDNPQAQPGVKAAEQQAAVEILAKLAAGAKVEELMGAEGDAPPEVSKHDDQLTPKERETLIQKINGMNVVQKIKAALTGNLETRMLLIRDSNKVVTRAVLQSPKISETEAESYAAAKNVSEEVLRLIATNRKFMKAYVVVRALINNPRTPIDVTMPLMGRMRDRDLKGLSLNRNVPDVIRNMAQKVIRQKEEASKLKLPGRH